MNGNRTEPSGILIINKSGGCTSHDVVNSVRRLMNTKRVGHTGTLDPLATGVLVVLVGRAAKASEYAVGGTKRYRATLRLGITTNTEDVTGKILTESDVNLSTEQVYTVSRRFIGQSEQIPPMYSALKVGGRKLYDIAREGRSIERTPRPIVISALECEHLSDNDYSLDVTCSAGTYIRTLCANIGEELGCGGCMAALERTEACGFNLTDAHTTDELANMTQDERTGLLLPVERLFSGLTELRLPVFFERLFRSGCEIYFSKLGTEPPAIGTRMRVCDIAGSFFAIGEVGEYDGGTAIKSLKLFVL